ncbi:hypothetical protein F2Q69_00023754 [Brassica cretica]|uniref:Uncharacterized protein n=1 Tax=Brassica cretica TaxID=69181 RepID=A0A8S9QV37_BRACR|nr:hypothetical protein F2Q69_00023754 [Brassica cretica]
MKAVSEEESEKSIAEEFCLFKPSRLCSCPFHHLRPPRSAFIGWERLFSGQVGVVQIRLLFIGLWKTWENMNILLWCTAYPQFRRRHWDMPQ